MNMNSKILAPNLDAIVFSLWRYLMRKLETLHLAYITNYNTMIWIWNVFKTLNLYSENNKSPSKQTFRTYWTDQFCGSLVASLCKQLEDAPLRTKVEALNTSSRLIKREETQFPNPTSRRIFKRIWLNNIGPWLTQGKAVRTNHKKILLNLTISNLLINFLSTTTFNLLQQLTSILVFLGVI